MRISKKGLAVIVGKASLLTAFYLGYHYHQDVERLRTNIFHGRTPVKEGYYQNISDLRIFREKKDGYFVPYYGINDKKIPIGEDLMPKNRSEGDKYDYRDIGNILTDFTSMYSDSLLFEERKYLLRKIEQAGDDLREVEIRRMMDTIGKKYKK
ncbi:MAG: hypothetical protein ACQEP1_06010 [Nanobdellota archaeon]